MRLDEETLDGILGLLVALAHSAIDGVDGASVSLIRTGRFETIHATSEDVGEADGAQYASGRGPCIEAVGGRRVHAVLTGSYDRWPDFVVAALAHGFRAVLSIPLAVGDQPLGSLNLYSRAEGPFGAVDESAADVFADHAAVVLSNATAFVTAEIVRAQFEEALSTRDLIGKAQGILMARRGCDEDEAFDLLRQASRRRNRKLREIAAELVASTARAHKRGKRP